MELIKWNPVRDMFNFRHNINTFFDDFFYPRQRTTRGDSLWDWNPVVDIFEEEDNIVIKAELPGVDKDAITIDVKDRVLTLKGERKSDNEVKEDSYYCRESSYGRFERSFTLPATVNSEKIKADYKGGILRIAVPKPEEQKPKQITVH